MIIKALILSFLISTVSGKTEFEECLLDNSGFLLTKDICLPSNYKTIAAGVNKVVKPIVRLSSLIELNKKFTSLSAIFDIYFIWKDDNLIANASSSNAVFFFNWFFSIETKKDHVKLDTSSELKYFHRHCFTSWTHLIFSTALKPLYD